MNERKIMRDKWKWVSQQLLISECRFLFLLVVFWFVLDHEQKNEMLNCIDLSTIIFFTISI